MCLAGTTSVSAQGRDISEDFAKCKVIENDQARLNCLKDLLPKPSSEPKASAADNSWPLVRTPHPQGGPEAVSIMRTADTAQSDPDLAGLMIRCKEGPGLEVLLALVRPFPPRSQERCGYYFVNDAIDPARGSLIRRNCACAPDRSHGIYHRPLARAERACRHDQGS